MALVFSIKALNHGSRVKSTDVQSLTATLATMVDYWTRLKPLMDARGLDIAGLARRLGVSYQAVAKVQRGGSFGSENNLKAAKEFGVDPHWLATGLGKANFIQSEVELQEVSRLRSLKKIPVVGEVKGGSDGYLEELQYPVGHGDGFVEYPAADSAAYALRVRGDSMHPRYRAGEFIVVSPSFEAQPGDDVVVSLKDGRKLLKQLNWLRDGEVQLLSINDTFAPLTITVAEVISMHLVDGRVRRTAFRPA